MSHNVQAVSKKEKNVGETANYSNMEMDAVAVATHEQIVEFSMQMQHM